MGYKGAVMRSINRPTAAKVGRPPRGQRQRKQTSSSSSSTASSSSSSDSGTSSNPGPGAAAAAPGPAPDLAPRKKLYISYNDIDVPAKIALTKISRRTKVLVYGKSAARFRI